MNPPDLFVFRFLLASAGCVAAGLAVWALTMLLRRLPGFQLQRSAWLLGQITIAAAFLVILLPHGERLRLVPPIEFDSAMEAGPIVIARAASPSSAASPGNPQSDSTVELSWFVLGARGWLGLYLLGLAWSILTLVHARRLLHGLAVAGCRVEALGQHLGFGSAQRPVKSVEVIEVDAPISPMLFGLLRPRLLLPRHLRSFDAIQQRMIVEHELTHVRRRDLHWMSAGLLLQTLLWFNPFMRLMRQQLSWAQELGCDRDVLAGRSLAERKAYAAALVAQLKTGRRPVNAALAFGGVSTSTVAARISLIREPGSGSSRWARLAAIGGLALVFAGSFVFQPALASRTSPLSAVANGASPLAFSCTELADAATGARLAHEGHCDERVTPASTFNIVVGLMGYDSGILVDEHAPAMPFKAGYPDWNPDWRATTDPTSWIKHSVLWYAQQVATGLGAQRFQNYVRQFGYGNQDVSGDPGEDNGLAMSWVGSSLKISPVEQVDFLRKMVNRQLPVSARAHDMTSRIMLSETLSNGWQVHGKTGTANAVLPNGDEDAAHQYGWYVGWATKGERTVVFARLVLDRRQESSAAGPRVKAAFLRELTGRLDSH